ncbi:hypothetical protein Sjap_024755 [Stephania japonica]|uniref:Protein BCCIP homolog n=1 Tax=Stephania japonica TaxID=461633 RepID=A0AAP0EJC0_9MAGN
MRRQPPRRNRRAHRGFSSFARSAARIASGNKGKQLSSPILERGAPSKSADNDFSKHKLKKKIESSESLSEEDNEETVQADFAFFDPKPSDFHGVKTLLQAYLDMKQWDLSGFVDLILGQPTVGTVVKIEDQEDDGLFSVVSVLNLDRYKKNKCMDEVKSFLLKLCEQNDAPVNMRALLTKQAHNVGLLISQRVVNLPPQLLPPLYDALFDEVSWATKDEPTEELRESFRFKYYILLTKIYERKSANKGKGTSRSSDDEPIIYAKPEDEIFHTLSSWSFDFPIRTQEVTAHELRNYNLKGLVMAIESEKVPSFRQELQSLINGS